MTSISYSFNGEVGCVGDQGAADVNPSADLVRVAGTQGWGRLSGHSSLDMLLKILLGGNSLEDKVGVKARKPTANVDRRIRVWSTARVVLETFKARSKTVSGQVTTA
jgi:hypothetical protein